MPSTLPGWKHSEETKEKLRAAHERSGYAARTPRKGVTLMCKVCSKEFYAPQNKKSRLYCGTSCAGKDCCAGERNPFFGKTHSEETREVLRAKASAQRERAVVLPTKPERIVHEELRRLGVSFLTEQSINGKFCVDVYIPSEKLIIFVDGCYWHACPEHCPSAKRPKQDAARIPYLTKCGYKVVILWEHEILEDVAKAMRNIFEGSQVANIPM